MTPNKPSVNVLAAPIVKQLVEGAQWLRLGVEKLSNGCTIVDAGINHPGGLEAGRMIAEICMGGLGRVSYSTGGVSPEWPVTIHVHTTDPVLSCLGSQYAGWSLSHGEGKDAFFSLGSGPARALAGREEIFKHLHYQDKAETTCLILEVDKAPPLPVIDKITKDCGISAANLTIILTPTRSLAGTSQVIARVVEVAMHKAHSLGFPLEQIVDAAGSAPMAPPAPDFVQAMGRTNDAILFGGQVQIYVQCEDDAAQQLAEKLPSSASSDYGRPFAKVFKDYGYDFFKVDPMLFSPARVIVSNLKSGRSFAAGKIDHELLQASFGKI